MWPSDHPWWADRIGAADKRGADHRMRLRLVAIAIALCCCRRSQRDNKPYDGSDTRTTVQQAAIAPQHRGALHAASVTKTASHCAHKQPLVTTTATYLGHRPHRLIRSDASPAAPLTATQHSFRTATVSSYTATPLPCTSLTTMLRAASYDSMSRPSQPLLPPSKVVVRPAAHLLVD